MLAMQIHANEGNWLALRRYHNTLEVTIQQVWKNWVIR